MVELVAVKFWRVVELLASRVPVVMSPMIAEFALKLVVDAKPDEKKFVVVAFVVVLV